MNNVRKFHKGLGKFHKGYQENFMEGQEKMKKSNIQNHRDKHGLKNLKKEQYSKIPNNIVLGPTQVKCRLLISGIFM